jgi:hypothetical protein
MILDRHFPDALPPVRPVPEYLATGALAERYADVKRTLQVPWMGVVTMAFAHYPTFFGELWRGLAPLCSTEAFVTGMRNLRAAAEGEVERLDPPPISERLGAQGYAPRELDQIQEIIEIFSHGNQPYVTIATIARLLLEGGEFGASQASRPFKGSYGPTVTAPLVLMEAHHADAPTRALYEDIKATLRLPIVNTDYRALARWPSYFSQAWGDLRPLAGGKTHEELCRTFHEHVVDLITSLPNPGGLDGQRLRAAARQDADVEEVLQVVRLFQWLLPGLVVNVAFFRAQLL